MAFQLTKSISLCTTCMNRLPHVKETIIRNILDNRSCENIEFVLLDYNSTDGLEDYVKNNLHSYIADGSISYYRTETPSVYSMSHSRNLAFRLAKGEILCNVDADNFTGKDFASHVLELFSSQEDIFLSTHKASWVKNDVLGRIAVRNRDFMALGGYDEQMKFYGFDDYDLINRLQIYGLKKVLIEEDRFLKAIAHSNADRMENWINHSNLSEMLISYISPAKSKLVFLWKDQRYTMGTMVSNENVRLLGNSTGTVSKYSFDVEEQYWSEGQWTHEKKQIHFNGAHRFIFDRSKTSDSWHLNGSGQVFYKIKNPRLIEDAIFFYHQTSNRAVMEDNLKAGRFRVNEPGFGMDVVTGNFQGKYSFDN